MEPKTCEYCGEKFVPKYRVTKKYWAKRRFCSDPCREQGHTPPLQTGRTTPLAERFWAKVDKKETEQCWLWSGAMDVFGYGRLYRTQKPKVTWYRAHRVAYELCIGPIPEGLQVLHKCDTPACVNPAHLWVGTPADNSDDKWTKGRAGDRRGMKNGHAKLSDAQVEEMRTLYAAGGISQARLGDMFNCSEAQARRIVKYLQRV